MSNFKGEFEGKEQINQNKFIKKFGIKRLNSTILVEICEKINGYSLLFKLDFLDIFIVETSGIGVLAQIENLYEFFCFYKKCN